MNNENILIVDDNPANLKLLSGMLTEYGYNVRPVPSGKLALSGAKAITPDLILLDIMMPDIDGYEVCKKIRADKKTENVPVIFISAINDTLDKVKAFSLGGTDYITKPFQLEEVLARVKTHLSIRKLQKKLENQLQEEARLNKKLKSAITKIKVLQELLPVCSNCKKIRDDEGYWHEVTTYIHEHSDIEFTHSICPECKKQLYPKYFK